MEKRKLGTTGPSVAFPPGVAAGTRYPEAQLAHMDSEKR